MEKLSQAQLQALLHYEPSTGQFTWLVGRTGGTRAGDAAGCLGAHGYWHIKVGGRLRKAHRLAWLYMTGGHPLAQIDHQDGVRTNNRWENLREATVQQNAHNKRLPRTNTSGYRGVTWSKKAGRWQAAIKVRGVTQFLGYFDDAAAAHAAYLVARQSAMVFQPIPRDCRGGA